MSREPISCFIDLDMDGKCQKKPLPHHQPKIIIIGAGIAGLAAGKYLELEGYTDYTILEASDRIGGRIWSVPIDSNGHKAEMGANWIHGVKSNPIYKIADENNLLTERELQLNDKNVYKSEDGIVIHEGTVKKVDFSYGIMLSSCEDFFHSRTPCADEKSVGTELDRLIELQIANTAGQERRELELVYHQRKLLECCISGCDTLYEVSLKEFGSYKELPGRHLVIPRGFNAILDIIRKGIPDDRIKLNTEVRCIHYGNRVNVAGGASCPPDMVCVQLENGKLMFADHVIVTVSLGVMKAACDRLFSPPLPDKKLEAIHHLGFGVVDKVILVFDGPLLKPPERRLHFAWDPNIQTHDNLKDKWFRKIYSLEVVADNVYVGWLSGTEAVYLESLSDEQVMEDLEKMLRIFVPPEDSPKLVKVIRTNWGQSKLHRGSYSYVAVGSTQEDIVNLKHPIIKSLDDNSKKPVLCFAGEATHPTFYSTTHGALLTGNREAARICKYWNPDDDDLSKFCELGLSDVEKSDSESSDDEDGGLCFM